MPNKINEIKNKEVIAAWLKKAEDDLAFAKVTLRETEFYDHVCYLSQQAVEKYLKALIIISKGTLAKEHKTRNLIYLIKICKDVIDLMSFETHLRKLTNAYIPARYPANGYVKFTKEEAKECLKNAEDIIKFIKDKVDLSIYFK